MTAPARRVVFFDVAGTLIGVRGSVGARYAALARRFGVEASAEALDRAFPAAFRAAPPMAFPGATPASVPARERQVWEGIVRHVFRSVGLGGDFGEGRFPAFFAALWDDFAGAEAWAVYPDVVPCLEAVRARGCRAGIVTNFDGRVVRLLEALGLAGRFDSITRSSEVGVAKPDPAIFRHALERHGVAPAEALHVGDSPGDDVAGAAAAGLLGVLVDRAGRHADPPGGVRIASLSDLARLV
jgi:putative hydrolase of the HAD superfamily